MSSVVEGIFPGPPTENGLAGDDLRASSERRASLRLPLQWPVYVTRVGGTHPFPTKTKNLSKNGFYCVLKERLAPGEHLECDLAVPTHLSWSCENVLFLRCEAQVVRVDCIDGDEGYGLACRIEDYCLIHA